MTEEEKKVWRMLLRQNTGVHPGDETAFRFNMEQFKGFMIYLQIEDIERNKVNNMLSVIDKMTECYERVFTQAQILAAVTEQQKAEINKLKNREK